ncbi:MULTISPECIES: hypothetical protein [Acinetobacter calcoaceticus/baumannii complex]|uniref:hypothetical protein n=1 Tax=Acinetobacter calcoaceticus/baumannii complex TaxID=909768 RepID=UPI000A3922FF|nr:MULTISPECIES: hypothetical protein [Acinetobacter calcoaceticus/baumannii complex]MDO7431836.1 hypothetical protein [Acinetobacter baumannii]OTU17923.1 hypothetical protein CAT62_17540 [Acinetobacter pittii]
MDQDWILQKKETRRTFANSTWIPLRASSSEEKGNVKNIGYISEFFGCGSAAFPSEKIEIAETLGWGDLGLSRDVAPYAYDDGYYSSIEQYQYNDRDPIGINLVFTHQQPVIGLTKWIINPDLIVALRLVKEGDNWVRPEEDFCVVIREFFDSKGNHRLIEIKREFLADYLAARGLSLRLSYYRQRVENVSNIEDSSYVGLESFKEQRDQGRFELLIRDLEKVYGGGWASFRVWRTDIDEEEDAPVMGPENNENTESESSEGHIEGYPGVRVEGEFWRDEWIVHQGRSIRVRGDMDINLPSFIVETDGKRISSLDLNNEDVGRWLWFRPSIVNELLNHRGFSLKWYTAETGGIQSTSGYSTHFGINDSDLITVYAYDIARLEAWEQHIWAAHNVAPEGKVSAELLSAQVKVQVASTYAVEELLFQSMRMLEQGFRKKFKIDLYRHDIDDSELTQSISRFMSRDRASLLRLAKDLIRVFSERLNITALRTLSAHKDKDKLGSNKLLEDILAQEIGNDKARKVFGVIAGTYDMRLGDAHQTSSKIEDALKLAKIDEQDSFLRQGEQLISNFGQTIWWIGKFLFGQKEAVD